MPNTIVGHIISNDNISWCQQTYLPLTIFKTIIKNN